MCRHAIENDGTDLPAMTPEEFCRQEPPRVIPARLRRLDPWLFGIWTLLTVIVLWVTFNLARNELAQLSIVGTYAIVACVFYTTGRRSRLRFRHLLQYGVAITGVVNERGTMSRELPKSKVTFYFIEVAFPGGELEPIKQTVPQAAWYRLTESTRVNILHDPRGKNGYLLVDILDLR